MDGGSFTPKLNCHVPCKRGKLQNKEAQHAKKTRIPKSSGKARILKKEKGISGIIKIMKKEILRKLKP